MSRSPSLSSSSESYSSYSEESKPDSFPEKLLFEIGVYYDTVESVPTEEEAAEYVEQLAFEDEEEQILLSCFFSGEEDIRDWYVFRVMKYKAFTTRIGKIKGMIECVYECQYFYFRINRFASAHKICMYFIVANSQFDRRVNDYKNYSFASV